jgi:NAD(P)-dependent dehydrogenase (short-subunit alcohol dehydrogenase family)
MRLEAKVAVITGAGAGLGRTSALLFAREGCSVVVADVNAERGQETVRLVREHGGRAVDCPTDVTREEQVKAAVETAVSEFGTLDIMFNNAGVSVRGLGTVPFEEMTEADMRRTLDVNLLGVMFGCKHALGPMRAGGGGSIVVTSSAAGLMAYPAFAVYCASKGGVNQLVKALAVDFGPYNVRVNAICPTHGMSPNFIMDPGAEVIGTSHEEAAGAWDPMATQLPLKVPRPPSLLDNAYAALFLASDESAYMSGVIIPTCDAATLSRVALFYPLEDLGLKG